jgi:sigma-B regulation protein RsbU (phosphoserine phosphatase)
MANRARSFWRSISDGITLQQLWLQLTTEARASYRLYSAEVDWARVRDAKRSRRAQRVVSGLFWAMVMKLSPARRVLLVAALIMLFFLGISFHSTQFEFQIPNLSFLSAILLFVLLALELADRVTMKRDLEIAKEIQTWLMPTAAPQVPGVEIAFATRAANTVAGDYYDAFLRSTTASDIETCPPVVLIVADVAGKSVPAALLMATLQASLRTLTGVCTSPVDLVERLNRYCCEQNIGGKRFTTAFLAEFDPQTRQLTYVNAGHNWPVLRHASGSVERLDTGGIPLGLMSNARYESAQISLATGDLLVAFTDGLVEAENIDEQEYGEPRMLATLAMCPGASASGVLRSLMTSADQFTGTAPQRDDITCLIMRVLPA